METESFDELVRAMAGMKFKALSRKKADDVSETLKDQVKAERDACKKELQKLKEQFFEKDSAAIAEEIADCREPIGVLIDLTEQFAKAFAEKKRSKNILDYADLEHFALEILVQQKDGCLVRTDAARELSEQFREIMIDEYQDSNFIQEALLSAVSGEEERQMEPVYGRRYQAEYLRIPPGAAGAVSGKISYVCERRGKPAEN
ncbi:MAG: UvrD-helicase domain-containing protein [Fusicatenibacter saccharivorans]